MQVKRPSIDVLVFDSGLGGLSVLSSMQSTLPHLKYAYLADNAALPYGEKPEAWLIDRVSKVIDSALHRLDARLLVIACNTASTLVLPRLRSEWDMPIVGVVPAIRPAAKLSRTRVIGLLATPATINRPYIDSLIREYGEDCEVIRVGSSALVEIAERKMRGEASAADLEVIAEICRPLRASAADVVILGCTHFPLLTDELRELLPGVLLIDSGQAIARRVASLLALDSSSVETQVHEQPAFFTANNPSPLAGVLARYGLNQLQTLPHLDLL